MHLPAAERIAGGIDQNAAQQYPRAGEPQIEPDGRARGDSAVPVAVTPSWVAATVTGPGATPLEPAGRSGRPARKPPMSPRLSYSSFAPAARRPAASTTRPSTVAPRDGRSSSSSPSSRRPRPRVCGPGNRALDPQVELAARESAAGWRRPRYRSGAKNGGGGDVEDLRRGVQADPRRRHRLARIVDDPDVDLDAAFELDLDPGAGRPFEVWQEARRAGFERHWAPAARPPSQKPPSSPDSARGASGAPAAPSSGEEDRADSRRNWAPATPSPAASTTRPASPASGASCCGGTSTRKSPGSGVRSSQSSAWPGAAKRIRHSGSPSARLRSGKGGSSGPASHRPAASVRAATRLLESPGCSSTVASGLGSPLDPSTWPWRKGGRRRRSGSSPFCQRGAGISQLRGRPPPPERRRRRGRPPGPPGRPAGGISACRDRPASPPRFRARSEARPERRPAGNAAGPWPWIDRPPSSSIGILPRVDGGSRPSRR